MTESEGAASRGGAAGRVLARHPVPRSQRSLEFRERVRDSLWFVPGVMAVAALVVSLACLALDRRLHLAPPDWFPATDVASASALTTTIAAATLTFMVTLFSTTIIAVQLASGQYSPRVVRVFVRSRFTHLTLGLYLAAFVVDVVALDAIRSDVDERQFVPALTVTLAYALLFATLVGFVVFLHRMTQLLRVQYLMRTVVSQGTAGLLACFPPREDYLEAARPSDSGVGTILRSEDSGVIQAINLDALVQRASAAGGWIELVVRTGQYVGPSTPVAVAREGPGGGAPLSATDVTSAFLMGPERTFVDDPGYPLRLLVDIAIRALSPAVNDPTTACQAIDRISDLLRRVAARPDPSGWYVDSAGEARVLAPQPGLAELLTLSFLEIIRYGADSPQVVRRLRGTLHELDQILREDAREHVDMLTMLLAAAVTESMPESMRVAARVEDARGLG